jgi:phage terminase small subunit
LQPATREWWRQTVTKWELEAHHVRLLTLAAEAWDRGQAARELLAVEGLTIKCRDGAKAHPATKIANDAAITFARLVRELDLDIEAPAEPAKRAPALRSIR